MIKEQNSKMLKNHNDLKTIFPNISKKPAPIKFVKDKASKRARTDEEFYED